MRLIDADALETHGQLEPMGNGQYEYVQVVYKDDIDAAPTIQEKKKCGYWLPDNTSYYETRFFCSECKHSQVIPTILWKPQRCYCQYCGSYNEGAMKAELELNTLHEEGTE